MDRSCWCIYSPPIYFIIERILGWLLCFLKETLLTLANRLRMFSKMLTLQYMAKWPATRSYCTRGILYLIIIQQYIDIDIITLNANDSQFSFDEEVHVMIEFIRIKLMEHHLDLSFEHIDHDELKILQTCAPTKLLLHVVIHIPVWFLITIRAATSLPTVQRWYSTILHCNMQKMTFCVAKPDQLMILRVSMTHLIIAKSRLRHHLYFINYSV